MINQKKKEKKRDKIMENNVSVNDWWLQGLGVRLLPMEQWLNWVPSAFAATAKPSSKTGSHGITVWIILTFFI